MSPDSPVAQNLRRLIDALRHELNHYGEMLGLLDLQQDHVMTRSADDVMNSVATINHQMSAIKAARDQRESCQQDIARSLGRDGESSFLHLIPLLPESHRGAVQSLVRENNALLVRVHQRARQNHLLLARSLEGMQQFIASLLPAAKPTTYNDTGRIEGPGLVVNRMYEAVG